MKNVTVTKRNTLLKERLRTGGVACQMEDNIMYREKFFVKLRAWRYKNEEKLFDCSNCFYINIERM